MNLVGVSYRWPDFGEIFGEVWLRYWSLRSHPFMTSTQRGEGVRLRWTGGGGQPHVNVHTENKN